MGSLPDRNLLIDVKKTFHTYEDIKEVFYEPRTTFAHKNISETDQCDESYRAFPLRQNKIHPQTLY